jgi:transposase
MAPTETKARVEKSLGWTVELVERPRKPAPKDVMIVWAQHWSKEGVSVHWEKLLPPRGFSALPRRWVVERTFAWLCHNRRISKDYERLCSTGEALVYAAMTRLMVRRLAQA